MNTKLDSLNWKRCHFRFPSYINEPLEPGNTCKKKTTPCKRVPVAAEIFDIAVSDVITAVSLKAKDSSFVLE